MLSGKWDTMTKKTIREQVVEEILVIKLTQSQRAILVLMRATGSWAIPEHGGLWRGADGARLNLSGRDLRGQENFRKLYDSGCVRRCRASAAVKEMHPPPWLSPARWAYQLTPPGIIEAERLPVEVKYE